MYLLIEDPEWLQLRQEELLADCGREVSRVAQEFNGFEGLV